MALLQPQIVNAIYDSTRYNNNLIALESSWQQYPFVVSGLTYAAGTGLSVNVSSGVVILGGYQSVGAFTLSGLADATTNHLYLVQSGTSFTSTSNTTGTAPANSVKLGTATTAGGVVTSVNLNRSSGRMAWVRPELQVPGGPGAGNLASINLANWNASAGDGVTVYGTLPAGAVSSPAFSSLSDVTFTSLAQGAVVYYNGTKWVNLNPGTSGYVLTTNGVGANPTWGMVGGGMVAPDFILSRGGQANPADPKYFTITPGADTALAASTEANDVLWSLNRTQQFAAGALTNQRAVYIRKPTYGFVGASTLTNAATMAIEGAPVAGTNATLTNTWALWIMGDTSRFDGTITCPGAGTNSERFGAGSLAAGAQSAAFGNGASAGFSFATALGRLAVGGDINTVAIGYNASASANYDVAIGANTSSSGRDVAIGTSVTTTGGNAVAVGCFASAVNGIAIGGNAVSSGGTAFAIGQNSLASGTGSACFGNDTTSAFTFAMAFGKNATTTAANQLVIGGASAGLNNVYIGSGVTDTTPMATTLNASGGSGTNIAGASLTLAAGKGTGSAVGGDLILKSTYAGGSGTTLNTLHELARLSQLGVWSLTQLTSVQDRTAVDLTPSWATSTDATRKARLVVNVWDTAAREALRLEASGSAAMLGHLGRAATTRQVSRSSDGVSTDTTVANTVTETTIFTGTVPANDMVVGSSYRCCVYGRYSGLVTDTFTLRFKMGGTTFLTLTSIGATLTNQEWSAEFVITCRTTGGTGTVISQAWAIINNLIASQSDTATHVVDTTAAENITITIQWSAASASDTLTLSQGWLEVVA